MEYRDALTRVVVVAHRPRFAESLNLTILAQRSTIFQISSHRAPPKIMLQRKTHVISDTMTQYSTHNFDSSTNRIPFSHYQTKRIQHGRHEFHEQVRRKAPKAPKEKKVKAPKEKKVKAPKEKKEKAPKDPNAPEKNFLGREKKTPRAELQAEIDRLGQELTAKNQELAYKSGELNAMKQWARSAPVS